MPSPFVDTGERKINKKQPALEVLMNCLSVCLLVIHPSMHLFIRSSTHLLFFPIHLSFIPSSSSFCTFVLSIHFTTYLTINLLAHLFICSFILLLIYHLFLFLSVYFSFGTHIGLVIIHNFLCYVALGFGLSSGLRWVRSICISIFVWTYTFLFLG